MLGCIKHIMADCIEKSERSLSRDARLSTIGVNNYSFTVVRERKGVDPVPLLEIFSTDGRRIGRDTFSPIYQYWTVNPDVLSKVTCGVYKPNETLPLFWKRYRELTGHRQRMTYEAFCEAAAKAGYKYENVR